MTRTFEHLVQISQVQLNFSTIFVTKLIKLINTLIINVITSDTRLLQRIQTIIQHFFEVVGLF